MTQTLQLHCMYNVHINMLKYASKHRHQHQHFIVNLKTLKNKILLNIFRFHPQKNVTHKKYL